MELDVEDPEMWNNGWALLKATPLLIIFLIPATLALEAPILLLSLVRRSWSSVETITGLWAVELAAAISLEFIGKGFLINKKSLPWAKTQYQEVSLLNI